MWNSSHLGVHLYTFPKYIVEYGYVDADSGSHFWEDSLTAPPLQKSSNIMLDDLRMLPGIYLPFHKSAGLLKVSCHFHKPCDNVPYPLSWIVTKSNVFRYMNIFPYDWLYLEAKDQTCDFSEIKAPLYKW